MSEKLLPCPFCGSTDLIDRDFHDEDGGYYEIGCKSCNGAREVFCGVHAGDRAEAVRRWNIRAPQSRASAPTPFQARVDDWLIACFGETIARDRIERNHRFIEEALELVQANGCTASEAHQLVDYVYGRPVGELHQEVGGVMNTLAALCLASGVNLNEAAETELARVWTKVEKIRAKQAAKPKHSPLPEVTPHSAASTVEPVALRPEVKEALESAHSLIVYFGNAHGSMESERGRLVHREVSSALLKIDNVLDAAPTTSLSDGEVKPSTAMTAEPVAWQRRLRKHVGDPWGDWHSCSPEQAEYANRNGHPADYQNALWAEARPVYATPPSSGNADAVRVALTDAETWCDMQAHAIGNVDGYDYRSGEEAAYRHCAIEMKKRAALADPRNERVTSQPDTDGATL